MYYWNIQQVSSLGRFGVQNLHVVSEGGNSFDKNNDVCVDLSLFRPRYIDIKTLPQR